MSGWCSAPSAGFAGATCCGGRFGRGTKPPCEFTRLMVGMNLRAIIVCAALAAVFGAVSPAASVSRTVTAPPPAEAPAPPTTVAPDEYGRGSPRGTVAGFLNATRARDYRRAARYLDLRRMPAAEAAAEGPVLARKLAVVLDNTRIDLGVLADEPEGLREPGMRAGRQTVSRLEASNETVSIVLERVPREDGLLIWQFSADTIKRVPNLYRNVSYGVVGEWLPPVFVEQRVLGLALWQWIGFLVLAGVSLLIAHVVVRPGMPVIRRILAATHLPFDDTAESAPVGPVRTLLALAIFRIGQPALSLPLVVVPVVSAVQKFLLVLVVTWLALQFISLTCLAARRRALNRGGSPTLVDLIQRALRIAVVVLGALLLFDAIGVQATTLVAAIGVGGIGIALAAQRTVENLFGGLVVIGDQPFRVGDFCRIGDRQGTVERVGLWSTRIRTVERSVVSVPNAQFFTMHVDNLARRDRMLFSTTLRLRYATTPDQIREVLAKIRGTLHAHPLVDPDPARVRLMGFGSDALEVEVFAYLRTTDFNEFVAVREELWLGIMDIVAAAGTAFALPERTIHLAGDGRIPVEVPRNTDRS
ncbi:MAG: hypothetical protein C5B48_09935 [Candidatus Rokuibacteriota bacterium]|nr:MAG: hypothetical protein C5B48_09935 [Candidatus Rokubacteria bacterium]